MEKFRIQPKEFVVSKDNPFENDLLDRQKMIESITYLVGATVGPCVIALDAPWGAGKTTFLRMWSQHMRNQKFTVVEFNAWETDFTDDPFMALCAELTGVLDAKKETKLSGKMDDVKEKMRLVFQHVGSNVVRHLSAGIIDPNTITAAQSKQITKAQVEDRLERYREAKGAIVTFRQALEDMAAELSGPGPLMVMIDELDRCRPLYAVELLETAKHLFAADQVVFVLAVNRIELQHVVKALYGNEFKADGYLRRFIDLDIHLPDPNLDNFVNEMFVSMGLKDNYWFEKLLTSFFRAASPPLRDIAQTAHRLCLVLNSLPDRENAVARMTAIALILRTLDEGLYHRFAKRGISDIDLANEIFNPSSSITHWRWTEEGVMFQTGIARAYWQMINKIEPTPLEEEIQRRIDSEEDEIINGALQTGRNIARKLLEHTDPTIPLFRSAYEHIELMFSLIDENSQ